MGFLKPVSLLVAGAAGPVAVSLVAAGFAVLGFAAGSWSGNRGQRELVEFIDRSEKKNEDHADVNRRSADETKDGSVKSELLLEYTYQDAPFVPKKMLRSMGAPRVASATAPKGAPEAEEAAFDVDRADALLQLAIDAYNHPPEGQGYHTQDVEGLPSVTFFDKDILKAIYSGVLMVTLEGASNLRPVSGKGSVSPYAEVYVTSGSFRTRADKNTANPAWNAKQAMFIRNPNWDALTVDVYDNNRAKDKLGTAVLGLAEMIDKGGREFKFRLPLRGPAGEYASVNLACRYLEFSEVDPETIKEIKPFATQSAKGEELTSGSTSGGSMPGKVAGMTPTAFVENKSTDTQVWLYSNAEERKLVFSFRGTETSQMKDVLTDANLAPCAFKPIQATPDGKPPKEKENINVHRGFNGAYESVRRKLSTLLHAITLSAGAGDPWDVLVTGHSLGGALATLAAYELAAFREHAGKIRSVTLYTYGCPRVGNSTFAKDFEKVLPDAWRVTNRRDLVPSIPPSGIMLKFTHVGNPVRLREDGIFYKGVENLKDDIEKDINWLASLFSWKGVKEHAGTYYQEMLNNGKKLMQTGGKAATAAAAAAATAITATTSSS